MSLNTILATAPLTSTGFHLKSTGTTIGNSLIWDNGTNVGIGNTNTSYTLDVSGTGRFTSTLLVSGALTSGQGKFWDGTQGMFIGAFTGGSGFGALYSTGVTPSGSNYSLAISSSETDLSVPTGGTLNLQIGSANKLTISSAGNVGIGTSSPAEKLDVAGTFKVSGSTFFAGSVYNYVGGAKFFAQGGLLNYLYSGTTSLQIINQADTAVLGTFSGTTGVYTASSDVNKKKDFEVSTIGLDAVMQLKPTLYRFKTQDDSDSKQLGFIAQEVKEFIPQAYEESGEDDKKFIGLNFNPIVATLVKAVQEQNQTIEELSNRLIKLESK